MNLPLDQVIVATLAEMLGQIRVANGYHTDAGEYVLTEQLREDIPPHAITLGIIDGTERLEGKGQGYPRRSGALDITVQIQVPVAVLEDGETVFKPARETARLVMADVRRCIGTRKLNDYSVAGGPGVFPRGISGISITGRTLPPVEDGGLYQEANVDFQFSFTEQLSPKE